MWADPNLNDFYSRVSKIEKARARGEGFEAEGTLGLSTQRRRRRRSIPLVLPFLTVLMLSVALKGAIHYRIGGDVYQARVDALMAGEGFDRLGGWLMTADPLTLRVSAFLREKLPAQI